MNEDTGDAEDKGEGVGEVYGCMEGTVKTRCLSSVGDEGGEVVSATTLWRRRGWGRGLWRSPRVC